MLIDTHTHLDYQQYRLDLENVLRRAKEAGVEKMIAIGTNLESSRKALVLAQKYPSVSAAAGIYPHSEPEHQTEEEIGKLVDGLETASVVAIGECGLDFAQLDQTDQKLGMAIRPKEQQQTLFEKQIDLAQKLDLPLIVHSREAARETYQTLVEKGVQRAIIHCFTYDWEWAQKFLDQGYYLSFTGIITFPKTTELQEVVAKTPLDRILAETDCPYLAPVPHRGQRNEPARVKYVYEKIAEVKGVAQLEVEEQIEENVQEVFGI